jgi:hypothetical protein
MALVHCFLLGGVACGVFGLRVLSRRRLFYSYKEQITVARLFFVFFFFLFRGLCASVMSLGHCVVAEAGCNWYLLDINICSFSKKNLKVLKLILLP